MIIDFFDLKFSTKKSIKIIDFDKFINENKTLLKTWMINVHIKMRLNFDHFVESNWIETNIEQIKILYVVNWMNDKIQNHFKSQIDVITFTIIDFESWKNIIIFIKQIYDEIDSKDNARRKLINLYQVNKNFEIFWSEFHRLNKVAKMSNVQIMKYLLNRLFKKFKDKLTNILNVSIILRSFFKMLRQFERKMKKFKEIKSRRFYRNNEISNTLNIVINIIRLNNKFRVVFFYQIYSFFCVIVKTFDVLYNHRVIHFQYFYRD